MKADTPQPDRHGTLHCSRCVHYWVTHDRAHPHGCRAFGIASARLPMLEVRASSGSDCEAFEPREARR